ncbi:MAG: ABC transporter permease [Candidatus Saccharimonadales bacterium]
MKQLTSRLGARYRYSTILLKQLVKSDFIIRYQNSVLGYLWTLLRPLFLFVILYLVFVKVLKTGGDIPNFGVYLLIGIVFWNYFMEVTSGSVGVIVFKGDIMRKVNFPRYVIVLAVSFAALINLLFNLVVVAVFMLIARTHISSSVVLFPALIAELFIFSLAVAFLLSALFVKYRDVGFIWDVGMQGAFFAVPIMYAFSLVTSRSQLVGKILISNPMAQIMQDARYMLVSTKTETVGSVFGTVWAWLIPLTIVAVICITSAIYFKRRSPYFAENV